MEISKRIMQNQTCVYEVNVKPRLKNAMFINQVFVLKLPIRVLTRCFIKPWSRYMFIFSLFIYV